MKLHVFLDKNGDVVSWATGNAEYENTITSKITGSSVVSIKSTYSISAEDLSGIHAGQISPKVLDEKLKLVKSQRATNEEIKEGKKNNIKNKIESGNYTLQDLAEALKDIL